MRRWAGEIADGSARRTALPFTVKVIIHVARTRLDPPRTGTGVEQIQTPTESFHKFTLRAPQTARTIPVLGRRDSSRREGRDYRAFARHSGCAAKRAARQWSLTTGGNGIAARPLLMRRFCDGATRGRMAGRERRVSAEFWTLMTDYYPVIARRIAGLKDNTAESRRALYQRVETVLVEQLRELDPPLEEPEILRERLSLEDAVRRVEADAERRVVDRSGESIPARRRFPRTRVAAFDGAFVATGIEAPGLVPGSENTDPRGPALDRSAPSAENADRRRGRGRLVHLMALTTAWFVVLASVALALTLYWHRDQLKAWLGTSPLAGWQREIIASRPKIADRVDPGQQALRAAGAQSASLYEEDPADRRGRRYAGSVIWKTEMVSREGEPQDLAIRAELEIPERHMRMILSLRRNPDKVLPASHTIEIAFASRPTGRASPGLRQR